MSNKKQIGTGYVRASFDPATINKENRTIDVVFATEYPVLRMGWDGMFNEILECSPQAVMIERLNSGAGPVLDTHDRYSVKTQLGAVEPGSVSIKSKQCRCTIRLSKREDVNGVWQDIEDGILRNISVGYNTYEVTIEEKQGEIPTYTATRWEPMEVSLVPVPADYNSKIRSSENTHEVTIINNNNSKNTTMAKERNDADQTPVAETTTETRQASNNSQPNAGDINQQDEKGKTIKAERFRSAEIIKACRTAKLPESFALTLIEGDLSIDECRAQIINKMAEKTQDISGAQTTVKVSADETDKRRTGLEKSIINRVSPKEVSAADAGEYRGMSLIDIARECLTATGESVRGLTAREVASKALGLVRSGYSTSDFPLILGNVFNKRLRKQYELQTRTFTPWASQTTATDFKEMSRLSLGDMVFEAVSEGGEYKSESLAESAEKYKVAKWGRIVVINWEAIVNDDLNAFSRIPQILAGAAAQKQSDIVYGILLDNPKMSDNVDLFHAATHKNLTSPGTDISIDSLGVGRAMMRKQKSLKDKNHLNISPKFLIVGPDKEQKALQFTSSNYVAAQNGNINVWAGMLQPIVENRITGNPWFLAADPSTIDTIEYAFLDGEELYTEERIAFEKDGLEIKARMVFGAKAIDHRGLYKNAGA